jgi:ubiquinone/menaquinone biosynthesis C-methylase UbiE
LESNSFDFINYAYVLHEMPAENALAVVGEMYRLLAPGGTMNGFEVWNSFHGILTFEIANSYQVR